jgi:hypothetical protein
LRASNCFDKKGFINIINGYIVFTNDKDANFLLGTLSATDIDTADNELTFTITTTSTSFKIVNNNELRRLVYPQCLVYWQ